MEASERDALCQGENERAGLFSQSLLSIVLYSIKLSADRHIEAFYQETVLKPAVQTFLFLDGYMKSANVKLQNVLFK